MTLPNDLPASPDGWAFFLDFDGTLADIAQTPESVVVPPELPDLLVRLSARAGGALALVSGRPMESLDRFLAPLQLPSAGIHGAELRFGDGRVEMAAAPQIEAVRGRLSALGVSHGLLIEEKSVSVTVHYRTRPDLRPVLEAEIRAIIAGNPDLVLQPGKMMLEVHPAGANKGRALARFMEEAPFAGRRPLAVGDDLTDEQMFRTAVDMGGLAVRVGSEERETAATIRISDTRTVRSWLSNLAAAPK